MLLGKSAVYRIEVVLASSGHFVVVLDFFNCVRDG